MVVEFARGMDDDKKPRFRRGGCGCLPGCGGFVLVFLLGGVLSLFNAVFGLGVSVGIPFTQSNVTVAGSIGGKEKAADALPNYVRERLEANQNLVNKWRTHTVGPGEAVGRWVSGTQA